MESICIQVSSVSLQSNAFTSKHCFLFGTILWGLTLRILTLTGTIMHISIQERRIICRRYLNAVNFCVPGTMSVLSVG